MNQGTLAAACVSVLLAACSLLPAHEPVDLYTLPASTTAASAGPAVPIALRIASPASGTQLGGSRIVVFASDNVLSVYKGARWSEAIPLLWRTRLIDAFHADGRFASISSDDNGAYADYELRSDLRAFQSEYRGDKPEVVISLDAMLVHTATRRVVASRRFEVRQPVNGREVPAVVRAFGTAGDAIAAQIVEWTTAQAAAATKQP